MLAINFYEFIKSLPVKHTLCFPYEYPMTYLFPGSFLCDDFRNVFVCRTVLFLFALDTQQAFSDFTKFVFEI